MHRRRSMVNWLLMAIAVAATGGVAQEEVSKPLAAAELRLVQRLTEARRPVVEAHIRQLETLQRRLSPNRDSEKIAKVSEQIERARNVLEDPTVLALDDRASAGEESGPAAATGAQAQADEEAAPEGSILAAGAEAECLGGLIYDRGSRSLTRWLQKGAGAEWTLEDVEPGDYRLFVVYSAAGDISGLELAVDDKVEELELPSTKGVVYYRSEDVMPLRGAGGGLRIAITVTKDNPRRWCRIRGVVLVPAAQAEGIESAIGFGP
ncbi:MAG TPA: hypothetical protein VMN36_17810 [Verrucomicrobiales bacterium]|nr:hypothetical protein [Verrucomicrobiales bacterium]